MKRLFGALGYRVEVVVLGNWRRCLLDAAAGRVDLVLAYRTPARDRDLAFSAEPVLREDVAIFYNRQRPVRIRSLGDLAGYRGGLLFGESYGADFDRFVGRHGNVEWVSDSRQNFGKLVRQRIDYIAHERRTGTLFAERLAGGENIRALPEPLTVDYLRVAVSRHSPLAAKMDEIDRPCVAIATTAASSVGWTTACATIGASPATARTPGERPRRSVGAAPAVAGAAVQPVFHCPRRRLAAVLRIPPRNA